MEEAIRIEDRWYVLATSSRPGDPARVLKHGETFAVFDRFGGIPRAGSGEHGIYHQGTRFLSRFELRLNGVRPTLLGSSVKLDNSLLTVDLTTPDLHEGDRIVVLKGTLHVARSRLLWEASCHERMHVVNYGHEAVSLRIALEFGADFADIFEVRGLKRERRGEDLPARITRERVVLGYKGLDRVVRETELAWTPPPARVGADRAEFDLLVQPRGVVELETTVTCNPRAAARIPMDFGKALICTEAALHAVKARGCTLRTSNEQFNGWIERSASDLTMLVSGNPEGPYPYAGVPWYSVPFGRDGIITAMQCLWSDPSVARGVLAFLARTQATEERPEQDAEPGKIVHEMRKGELAALGEIPFGCYYGSVDSTPLFVALAGAYYERTADADFIRGLWPSIERALAWIERYGDSDGDGFVEYRRRSNRGLVQQGWKDSEDSVFHADGELAEAPIALCEVQAYVYMAKRRAADAADGLGMHERANALRRDADHLRERFEQAFWLEDMGTYALALDGRKQPCRVRSSNAGQVLWTGIASRERAERVAQTLLAPGSFSGWGVRTIPEGEARYNPMSYHNGSIWPHDNAIIAMGFASYEMKDRTAAVLSALFDASQFMDLHRLPELYCGFRRRPDEGPTLYPVACSPQAWAAASVFYLIQACLGLTFHPQAPRIRFVHPRLPECVKHMTIGNLRIGEAVVDLYLERHENDVGISITSKTGDVQVSVVL